MSSVHRSGNLTAMQRESPYALGHMLCSVMTHVLHDATIGSVMSKAAPCVMVVNSKLVN